MACVVEARCCCLQELKTAHRDFPLGPIQGAGYQAVWKGEKTWNGVAILARDADLVIRRDALPGEPSDEQSRAGTPSLIRLAACLFSRSSHAGL